MNVTCILIFVINVFVVASIDRYVRRPSQKLNVVLFFAESSNMPISDVAVKFLEMHEMTRVKPHADLDTEDSHQFLRKRCAEKCKNLLNKALESLTHFCRNALGMNTAFTTVSSYSSVGKQKISSPSEPVQSKDVEPNNEQLETGSKHRLNLETMPAVTKDKTNSKDIVMSPEHTEVFKIRTKRNSTLTIESDDANSQNEVGNNFGRSADEFIGEPVTNNKNKSPWDILDVMSHVRYSFFKNLFEDQKKEKLSKEENDVLKNVLSHKKKYSGLFETVQSTLSSLQESPDPFIMIIFGGHLQEINGTHCPLIQTLKHVMENTEPENTLIVLTGNCPQIKNFNNGVVEIKENAKMSQQILTFPVYAKGPGCAELSQCNLVYEIPESVKNILEEMYPTFEDK